MDADSSIQAEVANWCDILCLVGAAALPLLSYPLSWMPSPWTQFRYTIVVPWTLILFVILLLGVAAKLPTLREGSAPRHFVWPGTLWVASLLVSVGFSQSRYLSVFALPAAFGNLALLWVACFFSENRLRALCWLWLLVASAVAVNALVRLGHEPEFVSTIGNRNFLGAYLAASIPLAVALRDKRAAILGGLLAAALCFTRSRGAWLALGITAAVWFALSRRGVNAVRQRRRGLAIVTAMVVGLAVLGRGYIVHVWHTDVRPVIWSGTLRMIAARPVIGHGLGTYWVQYAGFRLPEYFARPKAGNFTNHAHNELLETAAEQGIIGLVAVLWLWITAFRNGVRAAADVTSKHHSLRWGLVGVALVFMLHGMVDVDLRSPPNQTLLWLILGLLASGRETPTTRVPLGSLPVRWMWAAGCAGVAAWVTYFAVIQPVRADYWERQARLSEAGGDRDAAVKAVQQCLEIQPLRVETRYFLAGVLAETPATYRLAIEEGLFLEKMAPDYSDLTFNIGQLYLKLQQPDKALPFLLRAAKINPYSAERHFALGAALAEASQRTAAEKELEAAIHLKSDYPEAVQLLQQLRQPPKPAP